MKITELNSDVYAAIYNLGFKDLYAHVKAIYESGDEFASDDSLVHVQRIPSAVDETGELVWLVEFVHEDKFMECKTSELMKWWEA